MVRNYKRKSGKGVFDNGITQSAVHEVVENGGKIRTVARDMQLDRMTLTRYVKNSGWSNQRTGHPGSKIKQKTGWHIFFPNFSHKRVGL